MQQAVSPPVFLFDGDCAFCSSCARWIQRWIPAPTPLVPWQFTDLDTLGVTIDEVDNSVVMVLADQGVHLGPDAFADLLRSSTSAPWRALGWILDRRVVQWLAWPPYRLIARNRHRMPGGTAQCSLPQSERSEMSGRA